MTNPPASVKLLPHKKNHSLHLNYCRKGTSSWYFPTSLIILIIIYFKYSQESKIYALIKKIKLPAVQRRLSSPTAAGEGEKLRKRTKRYSNRPQSLSIWLFDFDANSSVVPELLFQSKGELFRLCFFECSHFAAAWYGRSTLRGRHFLITFGVNENINIRTLWR